MTWIEAALRGFWLKIAQSAASDDKSLAVARILFAGYLIIFAFPSFGWIHKAPPAFFIPHPLNAAYLFTGFPEYPFFHLVEILIAIALAGLLLGVRARWCGMITAILLVVANSFAYSFGKIDHSIMLPACLFGLSFTNWGTSHAFLPDRSVKGHQQKMVMAILALTLSFGMFTAGFPKALNWIDFDASQGGFLSWFYGGYF